MACLIVLGLLVVTALLAPILAPDDPTKQDIYQRLKSPSSSHLLGTDGLGRDILSRLIYANRITLSAVLYAVSTGILLGLTTGLVAGYVGGLLDSVLSRASDALLSLPSLILALAFVGVLGPGLTNAMIAVGLVLTPRFFRVARSAAVTVRTEPYIEACEASGCSRWRLLWRHVLPNASSVLLVQITFSAGVVIVSEASLSFLGLGVLPPDSSWGTMLRDAFTTIRLSTWGMIPPSVMIVVAIFTLSMVGDGLRDALEGKHAG